MYQRIDQYLLMGAILCIFIFESCHSNSTSCFWLHCIGFNRKEFRGKLAIAITANFINRHSQAEAMVEEISGVAFIFNQKFFQDLKRDTGIDLENIVYYKDDTHYFVMTAKKQSLLAKGVIVQVSAGRVSSVGGGERLWLIFHWMGSRLSWRGFWRQKYPTNSSIFCKICPF